MKGMNIKPNTCPIELVFLCGARDFHAMDWYRSAKKKLIVTKVSVLTDLIEGEGFKKLVKDDDEVHRLFTVDSLLFRKQSRMADIWRNIVKLFVLPLQIVLLRRFYKTHPNAVFWAHGIYYLKIASRANVPYFGTPQGSELLVRPYKSNMYKRFAEDALKDARFVTVDSIKMRESARALYGVKPYVVQNGIDIETIKKTKKENPLNERTTTFLSLRGFTPLYRIKEIVAGRNESDRYSGYPIQFIYPFAEKRYVDEVSSVLSHNDALFGRLERDKMYKKLLNSKIVFSIPKSDSSPRSVYEAIFLGCVVIITYNSYYDSLPMCMKSRIVVTDIEENDWFDKAVNKALSICEVPLQNTTDAEKVFDQDHSIVKVYEILEDLFNITH